jgi:two-component system, OmpR family, sensor kinase
MATIRSKLTVAYAGALLGSLAVFSLALYAARRSNARTEAQRELLVRADEAQRVLRFAATAHEPLTTTTRDSLVGALITPRMATILDGLPDYVVLFDKDSRAVYFSPQVRELRQRDQNATEIERDRGSDYDRLMTEAISLAPGNLTFPILIAGNDVMLVSLPESDQTTLVTRVVVGRAVNLTSGWLNEFLATILVVAPLVIGISVGTAYLIAGRAVEPVGQMINDVEAITDGRSLHRRLPVETTGDELARLGATLNAMIARLETSFSALRRFTADASHELKTPLAVLRADVERAMHSHPGSNEQLVALEEALQETTRMADLVDSLLTLARADEGRFDLYREPFPLEPLVHEVFETAVILGEDAGLEVSLSAVEDATIMGDRIRLRQLFLNLVTNAIKYTSRGGTVEVTLKRRDGEVQFAVRDTGIGIAAADLPYIFERFWRADRARSRLSERGGFGLGLAISQWIAQAHGGSLTVQSRLHRGSTFTVSLPIAQLATRPDAGEDRQGALADPLSSPTDAAPRAHALGD